MSCSSLIATQKKTFQNVSNPALHDASSRLNKASQQPSKNSIKIANANIQKAPTALIDRLGSPNDIEDATEYEIEIYNLMKDEEMRFLPNPNYFKIQSSVTPRMRAIVVDWLVDVHRKLQMHTDTLYLTINLIDRYLSFNNLEKQALQKLGCAALLVASKNYEIYTPSLEDLSYVSCNAFSVRELNQMESLLLQSVQYHINPIVPSMFLKRYLRVVNADFKLSMLAHFICECSLLDIDFFEETPSKIAAGSIFIAQHILRGPQQWNTYMETNTGYSCENLKNVVNKLLQSVSTIKTCRFTAIKKKYSINSMEGVSRLSFPEFIEI
ncbi:Cyclin-A3-2 [Tritrichomonas foetus]|uniref:Cyclin-A3-2 n=1 Tax=Tritrichomonas foetus TaxID=1144522 RepID=A0A1J4K3K0_9EUKA|nr:Cyclin-A3-2 [Tritrichomonas foetus]|eukprot:OHT05951.1 Cyclin-A3-2 [Tritrichomonas foetus]